jgi:hypothetical protein
MSEQEVSKVEVLGPDLEELQGLIEYLGRSFFRAFSATASIPWDFQLRLGNDVNVSSDDKTEMGYHLGWITGLIDALRFAIEQEADHGILDRPEIVKRFMWIMSDLAKLYEDYINGKVREAPRVHDSLVDIQNRVENFVRDFMILLRTES